MLTQALIAAAGTVTPTPAPDPEAGNNFSLAAITRDADPVWPRAFAPAVRSYSGEYQQLGCLVYDWEHNNRIWIHHTNDNTIRQYNLTYPGYVSNVAVSGISLSMSGIETTPKAFTFGASGSKLYVVAATRIRQFALSTAYDVSTATLEKTLDLVPITVISDTGPNPYGIQFNHTGRKMYWGGRFYNSNTNWAYGILQFTLSTAWDIETATWDGQSTFPRLQLGGMGTMTTPLNVRSLTYSNDGFKIFAAIGQRSASSSNQVGRYYFYQINLQDSAQLGYVDSVTKIDLGSSTDVTYVNPEQTRLYTIYGGYIRQYNFGVAGDSSTLGYAGAYHVGVGSLINESYPTAIAFSYDGTRAYLGCSGQNRIFLLRLDYPWEIATAQWEGAKSIKFYNLTKIESGPTAIYWSPDGYRLYLTGVYSGGGRFLRELLVDQPFTFAGIRVLARRSVPYATHMSFSPDGSVMLIVSLYNDRVYSYFGGSFSPMGMSAGPTLYISNPGAAAFHGNGNLLYISSGSRIYEYRLRSPFNITKPTYTKYNYSVGTSVKAMQFSPDGSSVILGFSSQAGNLRQLFLSNPWDFRSVYARFDISVRPLTRDWVGLQALVGFNVSQDGSRLSVLTSKDNIFMYTLNQNWTLSSVVYESGDPDYIDTVITGYVNSLYNVRSISFSPDGLNMYAAQERTSEGGRYGTDGSKVVQFRLRDSWDLNYAAPTGTLYFNSYHIGTGAAYSFDMALDGSHFLLGTETNITKVPLSTPFQVQTAQNPSRTNTPGTWSYSSTETVSDFYIRPDGGKFYLTVSSRSSVYEYNLTTAYQIYTGVSPGVGAGRGISNVVSCKFNASGTAAYPVHAMNLFSRLQLTSPWSIASASIINPIYGTPTRGSGWETYYNTSLYNCFKFGANGARMITVYTGDGYQRINNLTLNGNYNINTPVSVGTWVPVEPTIKNISFRYDGFAIYITSYSNNRGPARIIEYETNTPWTALNAPTRGQITRQVRYLATAPETLPRAFVMRPDGGQIWILGSSRRTIRSYNLLIPYNISSAIFVYEMGIAADRGGSYPVDLLFSSFGKKFLIAETAPSSVSTGGAIHEYRCTRAFDISSAEWVRTYHYGNISHNTKLGGIDVSHDGKLLFTMGGNLMFSFKLSD
jgi:hypothetical protein